MCCASLLETVTEKMGRNSRRSASIILVSFRAQPRLAIRSILSRPYGTPIFHAFLYPGAVRKGGEPLLGYFRSSLRDWEALTQPTTAEYEADSESIRERTPSRPQ